MNDPNGMVFFAGEYHLFYQYNPFGDKWGHMSWGHAVSRDLVHWEHLPLALAGGDGVMIFSGSAVVDWKNTSGFGKVGQPPLVAIYTGHYTTKPLQNQNIAYSTDRGRTWTKFSGNPVLDIGDRDFRDPKVFWHAPTQRWVMVVAWPVQRKVRFYASSDLKQWTHLSDFGPAGSTKGVWECPDLFPLEVEGKRDMSKWALIVNVGSGAPAGGSGCQYFVGDFDGTGFLLDQSSQPKVAPELVPDGNIDHIILADAPARSATEPALWADYGRDFYAAVSWSDIPKRDGRRLWIGWMSNWEYAQDVPTSPWRSAMSLPRELALRASPGGLRLVQRPVRELQKLRARHHRLRNATVNEANTWLEKRDSLGELLEVVIEFGSAAKAGNFGLRVSTGESEQTRVGCDLAANGRLFLDRTYSGRVDFHPRFTGVQEAPLSAHDGRLKLHVFLDTSSIEAFANDGEPVLTGLLFPSSGNRKLALFSSSDALEVKALEVWELKPSWR